MCAGSYDVEVCHIVYLLLKYLDRQCRTWHLVRSTLFAVHSAVFKHINKQIAKWICSNFRTNIVMTSGAPIHKVNNYAVLETSQTNLRSLLTYLFFPRKKVGGEALWVKGRRGHLYQFIPRNQMDLFKF